MSRTCGTCRFCCWAYTIKELSKPSLEHCVHECAEGCRVHATHLQPKECVEFGCPYLAGDPIHRPDSFQEVLESSGMKTRSFVPWIPITIPLEEAIEMIRSTRTIMAGLFREGRWHLVSLILDPPAGQVFTGSHRAESQWFELLKKHSHGQASHGRVQGCSGGCQQRR